MISVALGGAIGAAARYLVGEYLNSITKSTIPLSIIIINVLGSFILGLMVHVSSEHLLLFIATGFCGGFTTYSTFSIEAFQLLKTKKYSQFFFYLMLTIFGSILGVLTGQFIIMWTD